MRIAALEGSLAHTEQSASGENLRMQEQIGTLQQVRMLIAVRTQSLLAMHLQLSSQALHKE